MQESILNESNVLFTAESEIKEICKPVFELLDLQYYSYGRFYDNGKCVLLSTNKNIFLNHFEKEYKLTVTPKEDNSNLKKIYNLILIDDNLPEIIADEYNLFNHGVMLDIIKKYPGYYEMFCYVAKKEATDPVNKFLNSLDKLENFSENFLESSKNNINSGIKNIIDLPISMKPLITGASRESKRNSYSIFHRGSSIFLSEKQLHCLSLLTTGKTTKEIARNMKISIKTVEDHLRAIKLKLKCNRKSALLYWNKE
ncbi:MAG: LuxR family transcriptional regulator [Gammaproteobacteria bacterium]|nr:MAG: LuxR family transcriptional regulator [Gammaproteobacteria bacterium]